MNRTWVAIILGVLLGFTLMGAILRGCESGAGAAAVPASALPSRPTSRIPARPAATPEPIQSLLATLGPSVAPVTRLDRTQFAAQGARDVTQRLNPAAAAPTPTSGLEFSRQLALSRAGGPGAAKTTLGRAAPPVGAVTDAGLRGEFARRNALLRQNAGEGTGMLDARLVAQSRLRSQIRRAQGRAPDRAGSQANADTAQNASGEIAGDRGGSNNLFDNVGDLLTQSRSGALTFNSGGGGGGGGFVTGGAIDQTPIGSDVAGDTPTPPDTGPPPGSDQPPSGSGDNGAGAPTDAPPSDAPPVAPVVAVWQPVSTDSSCGGISGTRTNDLFLGFTDPVGVQIITSAPPVSLNIVGGVFIQNSAGSNLPPDDATQAADPCVAFDSFLTLGDADGVFFAQAPDRADWGTELGAVWVTPLTSVFGVVGTQDPARFGDDRYYIRVGRFTATGNPDFVGGSLVVNAFNTATFSTDTLIVPVQHSADLWSVENTGPSVSLVGFSFDTSTVLGGATATGTVTISDPAPAGGVDIILASSSTLLDIPASLTIPEGATSASFEVVTPAVPGTVNITISARLGATVIFAGLRLDAVPTDEVLRAVSVSPKIIRGGETAIGRVTLARVAPAGGRIVALSVSDPTIVTVPQSVTVPAGATEATFAVRALVLPERRSALIWAAVGEQVRTTSILVTLPADLSGDGRVDGADLAQLLNAFNTGDPQADLNGDGAVDGADLAVILNDFNPSAPPPDLDPFSGEVIARWIPAAISSDCPDLAGDRTNDLYLGFRLRPSPPVLTSADATQVTIANGSFFQNSLGGNGGPPSPALISLFPCLAFDSYLTIGGANPTFVTSPDRADWGAALDALWFTLDLDRIFIEQDTAKFGDSRFYVRIGRFTANEGAQVAGAIRVDVAIGGGPVQTEIAQITNCPVCWRSFDLTGDGLVSVADLERVMDRVGTQDASADLDGDGVVTASDVALFVQSAALASGG